ncbi:MAG TPA: hypothetical protein PLM93_01910 [Sulfuricurvum sp.]|nr:hypothetical protein [Sulfuricurvum sp.]HQT35837.1 hypothetical protein [Sulfuricurvum sp.]
MNSIIYEKIFIRSATRAGQRYMPFLSADMPNIQLKYSRYIDALLLNERYVDSLKLVNKKLAEYCYDTHCFKPKKVAKSIDPFISNIYEGIENISIDLNDLTRINDYKNFVNRVKNLIENKRFHYQHLRYKDGIESKDKEHYGYLENKYHDLFDTIESIENQLDYLKHQFLEKPYFLVLGEAGIGKTHFLLDTTKVLIEHQTHALIFLGEIFKNDDSILETIKKELCISLSDTDFLCELNEIAIRSNTRFLIEIDAINEIDINAEKIKDKLDVFISEIKKFQHIAVVLSCRTPYQHQLIPNLYDFFVFVLPGLPQDEALRQFALAFDIQPIELPYIMHEMSNPLFLKTMFETITLEKNRDSSLQVSKLLAKGNESIKELFEKYIIEHSIHIFKAKKHRLLLWNDVIKPMCKLNYDGLLKDKQYELTEASVIAIVDENIATDILTKADIPDSKSLVDLLVNIGILRRDIDYKSKQEILKVTYQKLYDYLMARYIFEVMPNTKSNVKEEISKAYEHLIEEFKYFSFIEALIVEFPTRNGQAEVFDFLSRDFLKKYGSNLMRSFIDGLIWRDYRSFSDRTRDFINLALRIDFDTTLECLFVLATKPSHPFAEKTFAFLQRPTMKERDLTLGMFLKHRLSDDNPIGLHLQWLYEHDKSKIDIRYAENLFIYLQWFLTLPIQDTRDQVTNILVDLGTVHLEALFSHISKNHMQIDDDYVNERLVGALYGAMMRLRSDETKYDLFEQISSWLYDQYFVNFTTYHIVILDYIKSIIELTLTVRPDFSIDKERVFKFYIHQKNDFWSLPSYSKSKDFLKSHSLYMEPMRMDFTNYTIGHLFPGRSNYGHTKNYNAAVLAINNRVHELGWNSTDFASLDKEFSNYYGRIGTNRIERYGKKYSWISYYEYAGYLVSTGQINPRDFRKEGSESEFERFWAQGVDPTFPSIDKFVRNERFLDILSDENIEKNIVNDEWIVIYGFARDKSNKWVEYSIGTSFSSMSDSFQYAREYKTFFGELFWSETLFKNSQFDICCNYGSADYESEYSTKFDLMIVTKEIANELSIKIDFAENLFVDSDGNQALKLFKFKNDEEVQEFTLMKRSLIEEYQSKHGFTLFMTFEKDNRQNERECFKKKYNFPVRENVIQNLFEFMSKIFQMVRNRMPKWKDTKIRLAIQNG